MRSFAAVGLFLAGSFCTVQAQNTGVIASVQTWPDTTDCTGNELTLDYTGQEDSSFCYSNVPGGSIANLAFYSSGDYECTGGAVTVYTTTDCSGSDSHEYEYNDLQTCTDVPGGFGSVQILCEATA
jgi:hypothetical protein